MKLSGRLFARHMQGSVFKLQYYKTHIKQSHLKSQINKYKLNIY